MRMSLVRKCSCFFSGENILEFNPPGIDKGTALVEFAEIMGIDVSQIIAIGDNFNDVSMIEAAGLGIAVCNAPESVRERADYVTEHDNNDSAVFEIINKFIEIF